MFLFLKKYILNLFSEKTKNGKNRNDMIAFYNLFCLFSRHRNTHLETSGKMQTMEMLCYRTTLITYYKDHVQNVTVQDTFRQSPGRTLKHSQKCKQSFYYHPTRYLLTRKKKRQTHKNKLFSLN